MRQSLFQRSVAPLIQSYAVSEMLYWYPYIVTESLCWNAMLKCYNVTGVAHCSGALLAFGRVFNTAVQKYLLPSDYVYVYLKAKLMPVRHLLQSTAKLWQVHATRLCSM